jgi:hypothetical protein
MVGFCVLEVNVLGPVQLYVAPPMLLAVRFTFPPWQTAELFPAVGATGVGFTKTVTVAGLLAQPLLAITVYVPLAATVLAAINGFCAVEEKLFGPDQLYVAPLIELAVKNKVSLAQIGPLEFAVGVAGAEFTATATVPEGLVQPLTVTVTEYVPAFAAVTFDIEGFCVFEVNVLGPLQL